MKTATKSFTLFIVSMFFFFTSFGQTTGRVIINEYMPWTSNGCGTTAEFIELMNFGPGPANIGCYIITTGKYSITIPPNTIVQPGDYFILSGKNFIGGNCANIDSGATGVTADLNWNTCNCTNIPVPVTGDGLMTDGGSSNTPLVLFDPNLNIVDAVVRNLPAEASVPITTSSVVGGCGSKNINLATLPIVYEELGMSAGRGNSFARNIDGDCGWVKDPQQSANAANNTDSVYLDIKYVFSLINSISCNGSTGSIGINVQYNNYAAIFPMSYTIGSDINNNGVMDLNDSYKTFVDSTAPSINVNNIPPGKYKITVASAKGCYLKTFDFTILDCFPVLDVNLEYFKYSNDKLGNHQLQWKMHSIENMQSVVVQKAKKNEAFVDEKMMMENAMVNGTKEYSLLIPDASYQNFRLMVTTRAGKVFYSPVVNAETQTSINKIWPNPAVGNLNVQLTSARAKNVSYTLYNSDGQSVKTGILQVNKGQTVSSVGLSSLQPAIYHLQVNGVTEDNQPISFKFVKH